MRTTPILFVMLAAGLLVAPAASSIGYACLLCHAVADDLGPAEGPAGGLDGIVPPPWLCRVLEQSEDLIQCGEHPVDYVHRLLGP